MKKYLLTAMALLLSLGFVNAVYAEPSEQETIKYLENKFDTCGKVSWRAKYKEKRHLTVNVWEDTSIKINNKMLVVSEMETSYHKNSDQPGIGSFFNNKKNYISQAMLQDLDPNIIVENYLHMPGRSYLEKAKGGAIIKVSCTSGKCFSSKRRIKNGKIKDDKLKWGDWGDWTTKNASSFRQTYAFCSEKGAKKIAKALSHLIKLNGGKEELF